MTAEAQSRGASTPSGAPSAAGWPGLLLVSLFAVAICTALAWVPKVLETPKGADLKEDVENMAVLRALIGR